MLYPIEEDIKISIRFTTGIPDQTRQLHVVMPLSPVAVVLLKIGGSRLGLRRGFEAAVYQRWRDTEEGQAPENQHVTYFKFYMMEFTIVDQDVKFDFRRPVDSYDVC